MILISRLLDSVVSEIDGRRDVGQIAVALTGRADRPISEVNVSYLIEHKLRPLGVMQDSRGSGPRPAPLLGMVAKSRAIPQHVVQRIARLLSPAFHTPIVVCVIVGIVAMETWLITAGHFTFNLQAFLEQPGELFLIVCLTLAASLFHELGHAAASHYGGATPGVIGVGIYLFWPAFYTELTDSYRLSRAGRLRADLGGIYFNLISILLLGLLHLGTGFHALIPAILVQHLVVLQQFVPFLRLDGYYVVSDLIGVPDLFAHMKAALAGLIPGRHAPAGLSELRPGVRTGLRVWALATLTVLSLATVLLVARLPAIAAGAGEQLRSQASALAASLRSGRQAAAAAASAHILILAIQKLGLALFGAKAAGRLVARPVHKAFTRWSRATVRG
jgi:putative peptide zinc metalloprotease protein